MNVKVVADGGGLQYERQLLTSTKISKKKNTIKLEDFHGQYRLSK